MRVYEVRPDVNNYQQLLHEDDDADTITYPITIGTPRGNRVVKRATFDFWERPMPDGWKPVPLYSPNPHLPAPDFWAIPRCQMAVSPRGFDYVQTHFEMAGQVLDLSYKKQTLKILNCTIVLDCLDHPNCAWDEDDDGQYKNLEDSIDRKIAFLPNRFDESSIFKIPEDTTMLFCFEQSGDPEEEFKAAVEQAKLTGLIFELVWEE